MLVRLKVNRATAIRTQYANTYVSMNEEEAKRYVAEGWAEYVEDEPEQPQATEPAGSRRKSK